MKILFAGDYVPRNRLAPLVENGDYGFIFDDVKGVLSGMDYSIVNFESPIVDNNDIPISKCGPNLRCTPNAVDAIKYAGFNCATLANNHIRDFGDLAIKRTMSILNQSGVDCVGAGANIEEASKVFYKEIAGNNIAIINCCENEFSIASKEHYGANPLNPIRQYYSIKDAKSKANYVLVIIHGGHEHYQLPSPRMQDTYRFFIDAGADIVVNHHQHCYSGYEIYNGKPIVYGLGNFCMDKKPVVIGQNWNFGYMVLWDTDKPCSFQIIPYEQCSEAPKVHLIKEDSFDKDLNRLNAIIAERAVLEKEINKYYLEEQKRIYNVLEPVQNRFIAGLQRRHVIPSLLTKEWLLKLQDFILCESHRDKMEYFFKNQ